MPITTICSFQLLIMVHLINKNIVKTGSLLLMALLYIALPHTCLAQTAVNGTVVDDYGYPYREPWCI
jgi:hypothetical protein